MATFKYYINRIHLAHINRKIEDKYNNINQLPVRPLRKAPLSSDKSVELKPWIALMIGTVVAVIVVNIMNDRKKK